MPLTYKTIQTILKDEWFVLNHQKGSHEQRYRWDFLATIPHKKEFPIGTAKSMLQQIAQATDKSIAYFIKTYVIKL